MVDRTKSRAPGTPGERTRALVQDDGSDDCNLRRRFRQRMIRHEGDRNDVYLDHLGKPTVGIGHLVKPVDRLKPGDRIDDFRKEMMWIADSSAALAAAKRQAAEADIDNEDFILALADVNFQLGTRWNGPRGFKPTWGLIVDGQYQAAVLRLEKSLWKKQTPKRVKNFQDALLSLSKTSAVRRWLSAELLRRHVVASRSANAQSRRQA